MSGLLVYLRDFSLTVWSSRCLKCEVGSRRMRRCEIKTVAGRLMTSSDWWYVCVITRITLQKPESLWKKYSRFDELQYFIYCAVFEFKMKPYELVTLFMPFAQQSTMQKLMLQQQTMCYTTIICLVSVTYILVMVLKSFSDTITVCNTNRHLRFDLRDY